MPAISPWRLFLPFAFGYFLSYLYRTVNGVAGPLLSHELGLADADLGLLTSTYFLAFGTAQLPLGLALDRFGPRRVEAGLLLIAALGAVIFAAASSLTELAIGRALIGLGVSACLMAPFKCFVLWFPPQQQASLTGWIMAAGGLGALAAAQPLEWLLTAWTWREVFYALAVITVCSSLALLLFVPEKPTGVQGGGLLEQWRGLQAILASAHFWRFAPMAFAITGGFMAVQGVWATRWMMVQEGMAAAEAAQRLTMIGLAMLAGFLFMGFFASRLAQRGIRLMDLYRWAMVCAVVAMLAITWVSGPLADLGWVVLGACFSLSNIQYSLVAAGFPVTVSGRANTAINVFAFLGAFCLQWGLGALIDTWQSFGDGEAVAYRWTFLSLSVLQVFALWWFWFSPAKKLA